jgi:ribA/ribD-fused uncharacterized protein
MSEHDLPLVKPGIYSFQGEYRWLSNFFFCFPIMLDGEQYRSTEHAYQAAKFEFGSEHRHIIRMTPSAGFVKSYARRYAKDINPEWNSLSLEYMYDLNYQKFRFKPDLQEKLLATGDLHIEEGNHWGDTFWGTCNGVGENHLGKILMRIREELRSAS